MMTCVLEDIGFGGVVTSVCTYLAAVMSGRVLILPSGTAHHLPLMEEE